MIDLDCTSGISRSINELIQLGSGRAVANSLISVFETNHRGFYFQTINHYHITYSPPLFENQKKNILPIKEAAEFLSLSVGHVYNLCCRREIPHRKNGKRLYFVVTELENWLLGDSK